MPGYKVLVNRLIEIRLDQVEFQTMYLQLEKQLIQTSSKKFLIICLEGTKKQTKHQIKIFKIHAIGQVCLQ